MPIGEGESNVINVLPDMEETRMHHTPARGVFPSRKAPGKLCHAGDRMFLQNTNRIAYRNP